MRSHAPLNCSMERKAADHDGQALAAAGTAALPPRRGRRQARRQPGHRPAMGGPGAARRGPAPRRAAPLLRRRGRRIPERRRPVTAPPEDATAHRIARMRALKPSGAYQALAYIAAARPGLADAALDFCDDTRLAEAVRAELGDLGNWKPAGVRNVSPAPEIVSGRDQPRPSGGPVTHELRYKPEIVEDDYGQAAVIRVTCTCPAAGPPYRRTFTESYTLEQLTRLAVQHESGVSP